MERKDSINIFEDKIKALKSENEFIIPERMYNEKENLKFESLFALSNSYLGIRGSHEERTKISLPYFYINGVFDKSETFMRELATLPNPLGIRFYIEKELIGIEDCEILEYLRELDIKNGILWKSLILRDSKGRETKIEGCRFASRKNIHRIGIIYNLTPINYDGIIEVESETDGSIINFADAPRFKVKHTVTLKNEKLSDFAGNYIEVATRDRNLHIGVGSYIDAFKDGESVLGNRNFNSFGEKSLEFADVKVKAGEKINFVKYIAVYTENDVHKEEIKKSVTKEITDFIQKGFYKEIVDHCLEYSKLWDMADIKIDCDKELNKAIRFNIFHLMSTGSSTNDSINIGAKLLTGEEYGGHAFWDTELFMLPFFSYVFPDIAKNLVSYRFNLLDAAKENAQKNGYKGAQYPWESADDGTEQCPAYTIEPDGSCYRCYVADYEHHVSAAVAYGIYNYTRITGDLEFFYNKGIYILIETARFWASRCEYIEKEDRYEIRKVTGPDEWHEPVDNNVYTNYLARWNLLYVKRKLDELKKDNYSLYSNVIEKTEFSDKEAAKLQAIADKIYLPKMAGRNILEQFEGYFDLKDCIIEKYDENDWPVRPEILKELTVDKTSLIKQADVVMLMYLLENEFSAEEIKDNYHYYEKRTLHGSSLSPAIYSIVGLRTGDKGKAYRYLRRAAFIDLLNLQKNTREGIHAANAGGVWQVIVFGFAGVKTDDRGELVINPNMPESWKNLNFKIWHNGKRLSINIYDDNSYKIEEI